MKVFLISLIALYLVTAALEYWYYSVRINTGKKLKNRLFEVSDNESELNRLYPTLKDYCKMANKELLSYPYNEDSNLLNRSVQAAMGRAIDKAIGVYIKHRHYCYVLFTIDNDRKSVTFFKMLFDIFIKAIGASVTTVITEVIERVLS